MLTTKNIILLILVGVLMVMSKKNTVTANCGCARCNKMAYLSSQWYLCCLYCVVNGKRSGDLPAYFRNRIENEGDVQHMANDFIIDRLY